jgi:L-lactate dehydrogenase complex protein LldG
MPITDDRATVFASIREALHQPGNKPRTAMPEWQPSDVVCRPPQDFATLAAHFTFKFTAAGGIVVEGIDGLDTFLQSQSLKHGYADPALGLQSDDYTLEHSLERSRIDDYTFGITRATAAIAETGSLVITERDTSARLAALAPWVHIAVLERSAIVPDMPSAIAQFGNDRATLFVTGPSKTADVEGILIKGVHGPGVQVCCLV